LLISIVKLIFRELYKYYFFIQSFEDEDVDRNFAIA